MNYIIFDLEATCWENDKTKQNETIEIGAVKVNEKLEIIDTFEYFIKPKLNPVLSDFCKKLTSITQEDVDNANDFEHVIYLFEQWVGKDYVLCSWGFYDKKQLKNDYELYNQRPNWINKHISLKHQFMENNSVGKRNSGMNGALRYLGIKPEGIHHRGIDDAKNIAKIFIKEFDKWRF